MHVIIRSDILGNALLWTHHILCRNMHITVIDHRTDVTSILIIVTFYLFSIHSKYTGQPHFHHPGENNNNNNSIPAFTAVGWSPSSSKSNHKVLYKFCDPNQHTGINSTTEDLIQMYDLSVNYDIFIAILQICLTTWLFGKLTWEDRFWVVLKFELSLLNFFWCDPKLTYWVSVASYIKWISSLIFADLPLLLMIKNSMQILYYNFTLKI